VGKFQKPKWSDIEDMLKFFRLGVAGQLFKNWFEELDVPKGLVDKAPETQTTALPGSL
jgi:hypothetical protein